MPSIGYRIARAEDAPAIADIYAPYVRDTIISFETDAPDASEIQARMARIGAQYPWLVATSDGRVTGYAYACEHRARLAYRWSVDVAVYLPASEHGKGIGRALIEASADIARQRGSHHLEWATAPDNATARRLYDSTGATRSTWIEYELDL